MRPPTGGSTGGHHYRYKTARRGYQQNPPFDKRITTLPGVAGVTNLKRGRLVTKDDGPALGWILHFLYNPSTISLSHDVAMNALAPGEQPANDVTDFQGNTLSSVTWSLLFDRTYETWDRSYRNKPAGKYGVYADVRALYGMLNMVKQRAIHNVDLITAPMQVQPVQVYFGGKGSLSYYGRIESATVDYTHWTTKMVPNRCVVGLTMTIWPKAPNPVDSSSSGSARGGATPKKKRRTVPHGAVDPRS